MASTTAAAAILVLRDRAVSSADVVTLAFEIVRVTGRTVRNGLCGRCVLRVRPRKGAVNAVAMTPVAARIHAVITRVIPPRIMTEDIRRPGVGRMAHVALDIRADVIPRLRPCATVTAVTVVTATIRAGIVEPGAPHEAGRGMAEVTVCRSRHVTDVLACRGYPVTGRAIVDDTGMIEHRTDKRAGVMTDTAILIGRHMVGRFADGKHIIMTRAAIVHDAGVTECCR